MQDLEKVKDLFLSDVDAEDYQDNLEIIKSWEKDLLQNEAFSSWQDNDVSKNIIKKLKESYVEFAIELSSNRKLTDEQRTTLWAKQDACAWLLSVINPNVKSDIEQIEKEIKTALNATN